MLSLLAATAIQTALVVPNPHVLVFSKTTGFRHDNIPSAIAAIKKLGEEHQFQVDATEDAAVFTDENLKKYDLICFASTTGTILDDNQKKAMERFVEGGKGWMGIHSASDTEYDWPWYGKLVGAYFRTHPPGGQHVLVNIENRGNPGTNTLPRFWVRPDEWYEWRENPRGKVTVLASLDEGFYKPEPQDHPIAWCHWQGKGRAWYTEMGHFKEAYSEKFYLEHLYGGLMWAAQGSAMPAGAEKPNWNGQIGKGVSFTSRGDYGDGYLHVEFKTTNNSRAFLYLQGRYGLSLAGSVGTDLQPSTAAGILYGNGQGYAPMTNANIGQDDWNVLDVVFRAPRFQGGKKVENARFVEVRLNGVVVQKDQDVDAPSEDALAKNESPKGPIYGRLVSGSTTIREVWVKKLSL